jgi:predicted MPP superfamily phosphohydrolase
MWRLIPFVVIPGLQFLLWRHTRTWIPPSAKAARNIHTGIFLLFNLAFLAVVSSRYFSHGLESWLFRDIAKPFYVWIIATGFLSLLVFAVFCVQVILRGLNKASDLVPGAKTLKRSVAASPAVQKFDASRRVFLRRGMYGITASAFGATGFGVFVAPATPTITRESMIISHLPPAFEGTTIGVVSDIHSSPAMTRDDMDGYVQELMRLSPDLIVVPGDFVNSATDEVYPFAESFGALQAPLGVYGVMGNHDFYASRPDIVAREVNRCGVNLLRNDGVTLRRGSDSIALLGIDDTGRPDRASGAMLSARKGSSLPDTTILLCHRPYFLEQASREGIDLMISGHTHGGQIVFARVGDISITPAQLFSPYVWGKYEWGDTKMYVTRGIGTVGLPVRMNCSPELVILTLTRGGASR